eukprot:TRINITY_DN58552_c0_g1_i1.p1 TRINITY_DN58552_c0_g1~~TRINITY_DN58552_c0_g1_i1.p1  ORF type:complete len:645 (-),score=128.77 TRINITY_DN58552_c0_g1_i1:217-2151(-)
MIGPGARSEPAYIFREALEAHFLRLEDQLVADHAATLDALGAPDVTNGAAWQVMPNGYGDAYHSNGHQSLISASKLADLPNMFRDCISRRLLDLQKLLVVEHAASIEGLMREMGCLRVQAKRYSVMHDKLAEGTVLSGGESDPEVQMPGIDPRGPGRRRPISWQPCLSAKAINSKEAVPDDHASSLPERQGRTSITGSSQSAGSTSYRASRIANHVWFSSEVVVPPRTEWLCQSNSKVCKSILANVGTWVVDATSFASLPEVQDRPLSSIVNYLLKLNRDDGNSLCWSLPRGIFNDAGSPVALQSRIAHFIEKVEMAYVNVPYHNNVHATDVVMTMEYMLKSSVLKSFCTPMEHMLCLIVAAIHDMGHNGRNNHFHINSRSALALQYNDRSPLENMHVAVAFEMMACQEDSDWMSLLNRKYTASERNSVPVDVSWAARKMMVSMVLATDTMTSPQLMEKWQGFLSREHLWDRAGTMIEMPGLRKPERAADRQLAFDVTLHMSDISNPCKPFKNALLWTKRLMLEFWAQGDEEASLGLPISPLCDRCTGMDTVPDTQIGFITHVVLPAYRGLCKFITETHEAVNTAEENVKLWEQKKKQELQFEQLFTENGFFSRSNTASDTLSISTSRKITATSVMTTHSSVLR